jgi:hypothetical protein
VVGVVGHDELASLGYADNSRTALAARSFIASTT